MSETKSKTVPCDFVSTLSQHWGECLRVRLELRRGKRGAWETVDDTELVVVEGVAVSLQARGLASRLVSLAREHVAELEVGHDCRLVVVTHDSEHESPAIHLPADGEGMTTGEPTADTFARVMAKSMSDIMRQNTDLVRACCEILRANASAVGSLSIMHGASADRMMDFRERVMEHDEKMRAWQTVDDLGEKFVGPIADGFAEWFKRSSGATVEVDPMALSRELVESVTTEQQVKLAGITDGDTVRDVVSALLAAANAKSPDEAWGAVEAALQRLAPHARKLQPILTPRQQAIIRQLYTEVQRRTR